MSTQTLASSTTLPHGARPLPQPTGHPDDPAEAVAATDWGARTAEPAVRPRQHPADAVCTTCGTSVPWTDTECAFCARQKASETGPGSTWVHWVVLVTTMSALFGGAYLLTQ